MMLFRRKNHKTTWAAGLVVLQACCRVPSSLKALNIDPYMTHTRAGLLSLRLTVRLNGLTWLYDLTT